MSAEKGEHGMSEHEGGPRRVLNVALSHRKRVEGVAMLPSVGSSICTSREHGVNSGPQAPRGREKGQKRAGEQGLGLHAVRSTAAQASRDSVCIVSGWPSAILHTMEGNATARPKPVLSRTGESAR